MKSAKPSAFFRFFVLLAFLAYPFAVFFLLDRVGPGGLGVALVILLSLRYSKQLLARPWLLLIGGLAIFLFVFLRPGQSELALRFYPTVVSLCMLTVFAFTLIKPPSVAEKFALLAGVSVTPGIRAYTRKVTQIWVVFFMANALVSGAIALKGSMAIWTLYNGFLSYLIIGLLLGGEYIYRRWRIVRDGEALEKTPSQSDQPVLDP